MAKFLDKDPFSYEQERAAFVNQLRQFHASKGTPFYRLPTIAGKELDLYLLYSKVVAWGGLTKVTDQGKWENLQEYFGIPTTCGHAAFALRQFYVKYLESYERIHHQGEDAEEVLRSRSRPATPSSQPQKRNIDTRKGLEIPEQLRINAGLSTQKPRLSDYDKIMFSLQSGLPNEVDFAINVCTLLSNEGRHVLHLERAVKLIDLLLAHCGVFYEGPGGFRSLYTEDWKPITQRDFVTFWYDTITDNDIREIIGPDTLRAKAHCKIKDAEKFTLRKLGLNDIEGQRILQVAVILRNLSFEDHNKRVMAAHRTFYRFLLLCVHNSCSALRQIGMDTLSNIAEEFILDPIDYRSTQLMFHTIDKAMKNQDKFIILRAMEVVEKLSQVDSNIDIIRQCMEERVYRSIIRLLTIHDVQLLLGALEVLLALSERGEVFCTRIATMEKSVDVLVCLVTLDAQSLGAEAFVGIKIVDHAPDGIHHPIVTMARHQPMSQATPPPPASAPSTATPPPPSTRPMQQQQQSTPTPPPAPAQPVNRDAENEKFTCQWLHSFFEADADASVSRLDLYSDYLSACSKASRVNMVTSTNFATCIKMVFPGAGFQRVDSESGAQVYITGIRKRVLPLPFNWLLYQQLPKPSPNYQPQLRGPQSNLASSIMQRMAQRLSPSSGASSSSSPQQRLFAQGMTSPGSTVMPPQMYRAGMIPGPPSGNTGSTSQLQQLILGHGLRQQTPSTQGQVGQPTSVGSTPANQGTQLQQAVQAKSSAQGLQKQVQTTHPVPPNCSLAVQSVPQKANSGDDSDMLSPQGSLVNHAGIPSAFLQNPLPQHSQAIANIDPSKSPGRSPASPGRAPPPYRPRSPAGSGAKPTVPTSSVSNSTTSTPPSPASCPTLPTSSETIPNEVLQEGEVKIEKIPNIHAQLPLDTNQVPVAFPQEGSENFPGNSIPLLQAKVAPAVSSSEPCSAQQQTPSQAKPGEVSTDANATQAAGAAAVTGSQQVVNIPGQQVFITQQLQHPSGIPINSQGIQISAQGIQINSQAVNHSQGNVVRNQQQIVAQGPQQSIQMQIPTTQVGVQQWIQAQPQGGQPNSQGIVNINGQNIVATNGIKGQPNMQIVQQGVLSGTHGIKIGALPVQANALPIQTGLKSDGQGMPHILPKTAPATQQVIVNTGAATNGGKMYSAYAVVQNVQRSVPNVLGQVTSTNPGQTGQGSTSATSQPSTSSSGAYIPIQPKLDGQQQLQQLQQQQYAVTQPQQLVHQHVVQPQQQQKQPQQQFILTSIQGTLPQQSFAVPTIASAHQVQQSFTVGVATHPASQTPTTVCSQNQSIGHAAARIQSQGQQITSAHIDSPLIKQLLQSGSSVHPPAPNQLPQQVVNPNMQSTVQWVVPQNPSGGAAPGYGLVNVQGPITQQGMPQAYTVNPTFTQMGHPTPAQPVMHFIPPVCTSPSPAQSPALSCSSSSSPNSTCKSYPMSPSPSPQHKSEKKSKSKSHKSKKSSKKKKSKSGSRSPPIICSKAEHGKDILKVHEKEASINLVENSSFAEDSSNQSSEKFEELNDSSKPCNNSESLEPKTQSETNSVKECGDHQANTKPTCNGSASNDSNQISDTNDIQRLKSKLEEASLKQSLLNGFGNGEDLDKKHHDVLIHRAEILLENSGKDLDKVLNSPRIRRKSEELAFKERTRRLSMELDAETEPSDKPCLNHIVNGDIPERKDEGDTLLNAMETENLAGEAKKDFNLPEDSADSKTNAEEMMDHMESKKDRDSESDSGIVLNERTGFMHDGSGAIIPVTAPITDSNKMSSQVAFCRDIREHLPADVPRLESNTNNNSNPSLSGAGDAGETATSASQEDPMEVCSTSPKPQQEATDTSNPSGAPLNPESSTTTETNSESSTPVVPGLVPLSQPQTPSSTSGSIPSIDSLVATSPPPSKPTEIKSEKSSSSKSSSKKSGKRSRHSSRESSSSSKKRRRSSSSSGSSHHKKSSSSSSDKSKHHHHHHHHQSSQQQQAQQQPAQQQPPEAEICICDWRGCRRNFKTRKSLHVHASTIHVMGPAYRGMCEWENCDNIQRQRWSCVSHMLEKHCSQQALRAAAEKRQQASTPSSTASSTSQLPPTPILYNAHTAYHAIRRSLHSPSLKDLLGESEGPVTKSIRITAALVLKNLATYSADARSSLRRHEIHLARLAISNAEASSSLAKCVGELNDSRHLVLSSDDEGDS